MTETEAVEPTPVESAPTVVADEVVDTSPVQALGKDFPVTGSTTIDSTMDSLPADAVAANEELAPSEPILHTFANLIPNAKSADATAPQQISADHAAAPGILEPTVESVLAPDQEGEFSMSTVESLSVEEPLAAKVAVIAPEPISTIEDAASDPNSVTSSTTDEEPLTVAELDAAVQDRVPTTEPGVPIADPEPTNAPPEPVPTSATLPTADVYQTASTGAPPAEVSAAKVDTLDESEANEQTPLASAVPLPAESQPQPFPLVLGNPETADTSDDVDLSHLDAPISPRSRLESTASSIFFPGGWFSKMPEGRASMDVAQGEFIPSSPTSPSMAQSEEKKGKWCVVM
ncbi:hypothetical protein B0H13DRAFT_847055 [Mycena leptocephala]|nr:hypothetical protein B0H13DRAFT_847055 [Mycena leptocephala]